MSRIVRAGVAVVLGALLVGCSDDPRPRMAPPDAPPSPSVSESVPASPTTGPKPPIRPDDASKPTADGAMAFVDFYWEMADYAQRTGDVSGLLLLGTEACEACRGGVDFVRQVYADGGVITGGETTRSKISAEAFAVRSREGFSVTLTVANTDQLVDYPGARKDETFNASTIRARFLVERRRASWVVAFWDTL